MLGWEFLLNVRRLKSLGLPVIMEMVLLDGDDPVATSRERLGTFKLRALRHVDIWVGISGAFFPASSPPVFPADDSVRSIPAVTAEPTPPCRPTSGLPRR